MSEASAPVAQPGAAAADDGFRLPGIPNWVGPTLAVLLCVGVALYPVIDSSFFGMGRIELTLFYMMAAIGLNFVHGFGGVLMVGQPALMTVAGYTAGILSVRYGWGFVATALLGILAAVALSVFMCSPSLRVQGWYLAVLSFMGVALVPDVVYAFYETTGGGDGLPGIGRVEFFGYEPPRWVVFEIILVTTIVFFVMTRNLIKSGWGISLLALRDHPFMASASGVNLIRVRAVVFMLSGVPCGVAGAMYAHSQEFFSATTFGPTIVLLLIGGVLLGGRGTLWGPVFGVTIFSTISLWLGPFNIWNPFILGMGVLGAALVFRLGIVGTARQFWGQHGPSKGAAARLLTEEEESDPTSAIVPVEEKPLLEVRGITKHFGGTYALQDVDLTVRGGTVTVVIGANGSGKTTLLNCVSGFITPDSGEVDWNGENIASVPPHHRAHRGIGRTFQVPRLIEELSVRENVELGVFGLHPQTVGASMFRMPRYYSRQAAAAERAVVACRALGLSDRAISAQASELTLALKRMVEIARALAAKATLICLDEPVAGLNFVAQARVQSVLRHLADSGRAVLLIEHNLPFVLSVADELVLLRDGKVEDRGTPADAGDHDRPLGSYFQTFVARDDRAKVEAAIRAAEEARERGDESARAR